MDTKCCQSTARCTLYLIGKHSSLLVALPMHYSVARKWVHWKTGQIFGVLGLIQQKQFHESNASAVLTVIIEQPFWISPCPFYFWSLLLCTYMALHMYFKPPVWDYLFESLYFSHLQWFVVYYQVLFSCFFTNVFLR